MILFVDTVAFCQIYLQVEKSKIFEQVIIYTALKISASDYMIGDHHLTSTPAQPSFVLDYLYLSISIYSAVYLSIHLST